LNNEIGSFGTLFRLFFEQQLDTVSSEHMMTQLVETMTSDFERSIGSGLLRIKAFLKCPDGYIKADITSLKREVSTESTMKRGMRRAKLAVNIVAQGLNEEEAKTILMEAMEKTLAPLNGRFSIIREHVQLH